MWLSWIHKRSWGENTALCSRRSYSHPMISCERKNHGLRAPSALKTNRSANAEDAASQANGKATANIHLLLIRGEHTCERGWVREVLKIYFELWSDGICRSTSRCGFRGFTRDHEVRTRPCVHGDRILTPWSRVKEKTTASEPPQRWRLIGQQTPRMLPPRPTGRPLQIYTCCWFVANTHGREGGRVTLWRRAIILCRKHLLKCSAEIL